MTSRDVAQHKASDFIVKSSPTGRCDSYPVPTAQVEAVYGTVVTPRPPSFGSSRALTSQSMTSPASSWLGSCCKKPRLVDPSS